jgi:Transglycosylase SLT domain
MKPDDFRRANPSGVGWKLTEQGIFVEGSGIERTPGFPRTVTTVRQTFGSEIDHAAAESGVPALLLLATVATESGGRANAVRFEPGYQDEASTPQRVSAGLMQTLLSTSQQMLQQSVGIKAMTEPSLSMRAGAMYIAYQAKATNLDPVLVAAAYNTGAVRIQGGPKNRWKLRQYPLGTSGYIDRFVQFYNDGVAVMGAGSTAGTQADSREQLQVASSGNGLPEVRFANAGNKAFVPNYAISVVQDLLRSSNNQRALVTSTLRNPSEQARVMFQNCEKHGAASQLKLYGAPGRAVVQEYVAAKEQGLGATDTQSRMRDAILRQGPYNVSHHAGDPTKLAVLDIAPSSLSHPSRFCDAARTDRRVSKLLVPPQDPAIHIEIPL